MAASATGRSVGLRMLGNGVMTFAGCAHLGEPDAGP
jgi:hypothetical protein